MNDMASEFEVYDYEIPNVDDGATMTWYKPNQARNVHEMRRS